MEVRQFILRALGMIAEAIAGLHRIDQDIGTAATGHVFCKAS